MVSHEMWNPLSAMLQCAEEVSQDILSLAAEDCCGKLLQKRLGTMTEALNTIQWCGRHQRQIIDDVLTISKLDSDLLTPAPVETIPADIIGQVLKIFASEAKTADIKISQSISSDSKHQHCMLDSSRVLQILINLVGNAIKFTKNRKFASWDCRSAPHQRSLKYLVRSSYHLRNSAGNCHHRQTPQASYMCSSLSRTPVPALRLTRWTACSHASNKPVHAPTLSTGVLAWISSSHANWQRCMAVRLV